MDPARERLDELRGRLVAQLAALRADHDAVVDASRDSNADDEHDPEGATIAFERAQVDALARSAQQRLEEVDAALQRLDDGTYGTCRTCGRPIAPERLEVRPAATTCATCRG
jgi:RNA polymerase-binding protein DksA